MVRNLKGHGTNGSYARGCRCDACTKAHRIYARAWRLGLLKQKEGVVAEPPETGPKAEAPRHWRHKGKCFDVPKWRVDSFFSEVDIVIDGAKLFCQDCPVKDKCLEWAIELEEVGVWGGTSDLDRRRIVRQRRTGM